MNMKQLTNLHKNSHDKTFKNKMIMKFCFDIVGFKEQMKIYEEFDLMSI